MNLVNLARHSQSVAPEQVHAIIEPILMVQPATLVPNQQRIELLTILLGNCRVQGHRGCFERWGEELLHLSLEAMWRNPDAAVSGLRVISAWKTSTGAYAEALKHGSEIPAEVLDRCSATARVSLAATLSGAASRLGDLDTAELLSAQSVDLADDDGDATLRGHARLCLANALKLRGRLREALGLYVQAEALHRMSGDLSLVVRDQLNRGLLLNRLGSTDEAVSILEAAHFRSREIGHPHLVLLTRLAVGMVAVRRGELERARRWLIRSWCDARRYGMARERILALEFLGEALAVQGKHAAAGRILSLCRRTAERLAPAGDIVAECGIRQAYLALRVGDAGDALTWAQRARECAVSAGLAWEEAQARRMEGAALFRAGRIDEACRTLVAARDKLRSMDERLELQFVDEWLGFLANSSGGMEPPLHPADRCDSGRTGAPIRASKSGDQALQTRVGYPQVARGPKGSKARSAGPGPGRDMWHELGLVTISSRMKSALAEAEVLATSGCAVLIQGETGTGKELLARGVHQLSGRRGALVPVNAGALPPELLESELFGVRRGAFTGAGESRDGLAVAANGGTLFLDEIGDLTPRGQAALLRFLDSGEVRPVGSTRATHVELGVLAATNRPLSEMVKRGDFRNDLYHRLAQGVLELPPLRERLDDLPSLVRMLWTRQTGGHELPAGLLDDDSVGLLRTYRWPGNVRELDHLLRRVRASLEHAGEDRVTLKLLATRMGMSRGEGTRKARRPRPGPEQVRQAMASAGGNLARAARLLGITRPTLYRLLGSAGETAVEGAEATD